MPAVKRIVFAQLFFAAACQTPLPAHTLPLLHLLAQRWEQLEESYRHVAAVPLGVKPAFKALQVG